MGKGPMELGVAAGPETTGISQEARQDAQDQADYIHVPSLILWLIWAVLLVLIVDWIADKVKLR